MRNKIIFYRYFKKILKFCRFLILISVVTFILSEITLRIMPYFVSDPLKSILTEIARYSLTNSREYTDFNKSGIVILLPPPQKKDIIVIGDSIPFGTNVSEKDAFPAIIQDMDSKKVANLGKGAANPVEYNRMMEIGMRYKPDLIIYCIFANDFMYFNKVNVTALSTDNTFIEKDSDKKLFISEITLSQRIEHYIKRVKSLSHTYQIVKLFLMLRAYPGQDPVETNIHGHYFQFQPKSSWDMLINLKNDIIKKNFDINVNLVNEAFLFARKNNAKFLLVLIPCKEMVYGRLAKEKDLIFDEAHLQTYTEFEKKMRELYIPVLNSTESLFYEAKKGRKLYFSIDGHLNETGHRQMARIIVDYLKTASI